MKNLFLLFCSIFLFSCSSNDDEVNSNNGNNNGNNPTSGRYKISFDAPGLNGNLNYKVTYKLDNTEQIITYNNTKTGFIIGDANNRIDFWIELISGNTYLDLNYITFKVEDLQKGTMRTISGLSTTGGYYPNQYILSPDMLTEFNFLSNLYGYSIGNPKNNYKTHFYTTLNSNGFGSQYGGNGISDSNYYNFRQDILVQKQTRGSLRISIENNHYLPSGQKGDYTLNISPNAWLIKDNSSDPNNGLLNVLESTSTINNGLYINNTNTNKTYELILPSNMSNISLKLKGMNVKAIISIMRKNGTSETLNITSTNNQITTQNFTSL